MSRQRSGTSVADRQESAVESSRSPQKMYGESLLMGKINKDEVKDPNHWRKKFRYVGPKREGKRAMEVFMEPEVRHEVKALAATQAMGAQEFVERLIVSEVNKNRPLVEQGLKLLELREKKPYRSKLQALEEENARLMEALKTSLKSPGRS